MNENLRPPNRARGPERKEEEYLPNSLAPKSPEVNKKVRNLEVEAVLQILQERWPNCFSIYERNRRPLKLLIHLEILRALDGAVTEPQLINALRCYVGNREYLKKIKVGADRVDLDGNVVGKVIESEELHARKNLGGQYNPPEPAWSRAWRFENEREAWKKIKKEYEKRIRA